MRRVILFLLFFLVLSVSSLINVSNAKADILLYFFTSYNRSNIIWQVGFTVLSNANSASLCREHTANGSYRCGGDQSANVWLDLVDGGACGTANQCGGGGFTGNDNPPYSIHWGTGCVDPFAGASNFFDTVSIAFVDVSLTRDNLDRLGNAIQQWSYNYLDDIQWFEDNGGQRINFGGFLVNNCPTRPRFACNTNGNGQCIQRNCNPATQNNCYNTGSCGGTNCNGPISGQVFLPGGTPLNGAEVDRNGGANQTTRNISGAGGSFLFSNLNMFSNHTIRLIRSNSSFNQCAYEINDNTRNVEVPNNNVNFQLNYVPYTINTHTYWDPEADGTRNGDYTRDSIRLEATPGGRDCTTSDGTCGITGNTTLPGGRDYEITLSGLQAGDIMFSANPVNRTITCANVGAPFEVTKGYRISGNIFKDLNHNGRYAPSTGDELYTTGNSGNTVGTNVVRIEEIGAIPAGRDRARINTSQTVTDGTYQFTNLFRGEYRITIDDGDFDPDGYRFSTPTNAARSYTVRVGPVSSGPVAFRCNAGGSPQGSCVNVSGGNWNGSVDDLNFGITPVYTVSGGVFVDRNNNETKDNNEPYIAGREVALRQNGANYPANSPLFSTANPQNTNSGYSFSLLLQESYRVVYNWTYAVYQFFDAVGPVATPPGTNPFFQLNLDRPPAANCVQPNVGNPGCFGFGIPNLNFALREITQEAWMQTFGGDVRLDKGITNEMPNGRNFSGNIDSNRVQNGIVFGSGIEIEPGNYNSRNWHVNDSGLGGLTNIKTSYRNLKDAIQKSGYGDIPSRTCSPCNISSLNQGRETVIFELNPSGGDTVLTSSANPYDVAPNKDYIILVPGNLRINTNIRVPANTRSTITFAVGGDITIDGAVTQLQGIYTSTGDFIFDTQVNDLTTGDIPDVPIRVEGSIIVGDQLRKGVYGTTRALTDRESRDGINGVGGPTSTIDIVYRPDFILNLPAIIRTALSKRIEVVPGE